MNPHLSAITTPTEKSTLSTLTRDILKEYSLLERRYGSDDEDFGQSVFDVATQGQKGNLDYDSDIEQSISLAMEKVITDEFKELYAECQDHIHELVTLKAQMVLCVAGQLQNRGYVAQYVDKLKQKEKVRNFKRRKLEDLSRKFDRDVGKFMKKEGIVEDVGCGIDTTIPKNLL